jgi:GH35 family endo-1,4-beta-xylanase
MPISLAVLVVLGTSSSQAAKMTEKEILGQADARIEKCRKGDALLKLLGPDGQPLPAGTRVTVVQTRHKFLFGANIYKFDDCRTPEQNAAYKQRFRELLNCATVRFYWASYEFEEGKLQFDDRRKIAQWCLENRITPKGHPLFWSECQPEWLHQKDPRDAEALAWSRIGREISAFRDVIPIWDVLNEPTKGIEHARQLKAITAQRIYERYGTVGVIKRAFDQARQANPKATLVLNDHPWPLDDPAIVLTGFEKIVSRCLADQVPLDAIGVQTHMVLKQREWSVQRTWEICEQFAQFGKPLHFTEVTIISGWHSNEERQARLAAEFYTILFSHPSVEAITWWDFTEQRYRGCITAPGAGLLRDDMTPKPAYHELKRLIKDKWWTQTRVSVSADGQARFRGFLGEYLVSATLGDRKVTGRFWLDTTVNKPITVPLK